MNPGEHCVSSKPTSGKLCGSALVGTNPEALFPDRPRFVSESSVFGEAPELPEATTRETDDCVLCLSTKSLQRDYPRDLTEFEARFADESACRDVLVPPALAGGFSVSPSSEE